MEPTDPKVIAVLSVVSVLAIGALVLVDTKDPTGKSYTVEAEALNGKTATVVETSKADSRWKTESKLLALDDGGLAAYAEVGDGGFVVLDAMPCARKPRGGACTKLDGGDPGNWNRYARAELTGKDCEPVPCSVFSGTQKADPDQP